MDSSSPWKNSREKNSEVKISCGLMTVLTLKLRPSELCFTQWKFLEQIVKNYTRNVTCILYIYICIYICKATYTCTCLTNILNIYLENLNMPLSYKDKICIGLFGRELPVEKDPGLAFWCSRWSCCLHRNIVGALDGVSAALFPRHLPPFVPPIFVKDDPSPWSFATHGRLQYGFRFWTSTLSNPGIVAILEGKKKTSFSFSQHVYLCVIRR